MNEEFEMLPFSAESGELEQERGARPFARGAMRTAPARSFGRFPMAQARPQQRGLRAPGRGPARPQPRVPGRAQTGFGFGRPPGRRPGGWPRPYRPYWPRFPVYPGWPWDGVLARPYPVPAYPAPEPYPEPYPEPGQEPGQEPDQEPFEPGQDGMDGEVPATLQGTLNRLPPALRPQYIALGALPAALGDARTNGPGLYLIEFVAAGRTRAYSGQTRNVRRRLQQHLLCARILGVPVNTHQVYIAPMQAATPAQRRDIEQRIHADMFAHHAGVLTNQRRELEAELFGEL